MDSTSEKNLDRLARLLKSLPKDIPCGSLKYNFQDWQPDPEEVADYGDEASVLNRRLEITFAPGGRKGGTRPFTLIEQGPGLLAVVGVLRQYLRSDPGSAVLSKWVDDLSLAATAAYDDAGIAPPSLSNPATSRVTAPIVSAMAKPPVKAGGKAPAKKKNLKRKGAAGEEVRECVWDDFLPSDYKAAPADTGRKPDRLVMELALSCYKIDDPDKTPLLRCPGMMPQGNNAVCDQTWAFPRNKMRILDHASTCEHLPFELKQRVNASLGKMSVTTRVQQGQEKMKEMMTNQIDLHLIKFVATSGIPMKTIANPHLNEMLKWAWSAYNLPSVSKLEGSLIPQEAGRIRTENLNALRKSNNLTITFDGNTTRLPQSVYTIHIITPEREVYIFEGHEASEESHTGEHLFEVLDEVVNGVGSERFIGAKYPWILNMADPCHRLNNLCKDICRLDHFKPVIKVTRRTTKYFKKGTAANTTLRKARLAMNIPRGLVSTATTRFGTNYHSSSSLQRCLPAIRDIVTRKLVVIPEHNSKFITASRSSSQFEVALNDFVLVLEPIAKAITCLESSHATVADVYLFHLAIMATLKDRFSEADDEEPKHDIPLPVVEKIRQLCNYRFNQTINDSPSDMFLAGFFLDPHYRYADILKGTANPLAIPKVRIRTKGNGKQAHIVANDPNACLDRIGNFLMTMLQREYEGRKETIGNLSAMDALKKLKKQVEGYARGDWPFDHPTDEKTPAIAWWQAIKPHPHAQVLAHLAIILLSITPNSMADERTASVFSWLNTARRNRQKASTLVKLCQLRAHYQNGGKLKATQGNRPTVKFRDLQSTILQKADIPRADRGQDESAQEGASVDDESDGSEEEEEQEVVDDADDDRSDVDALDDVQLVEVPGDHFSVDDVDLDIAELRDVLASEPMEGDSAEAHDGDVPAPSEAAGQPAPNVWVW
ncbi:hypothetical protein ONZ45_g6996 [Pleurotus djamor]|nr:hypothetical protein ONZ45_g6996 [Pleurotus djamor]